MIRALRTSSHVLDLIKSVCCRPGRAGNNILPAEEEEGKSVPVNLLTVSNFQKALKTFHDSIPFCRTLTPTMSTCNVVAL